MRRILLACSLVVLGALPALAVPGHGRGGGNGGGNKPCDAAALAAAQQIVDAACDCDNASRHGQYVSCAARALNAALKNGDVPKACKHLIRRGVARSTCGKTGFVACCRPARGGGQACSVKREGRCEQPACASPKPSCLDACTDTGCAASPSGAFVGGR